MIRPKNLFELKDLLLRSEEIHSLVLKRSGKGAEQWESFLKGENLDDLFEIVEEESHEITEEPVSFIEGAAPDNDIFHINIHKLGPLFFITANEFDDIGYFESEEEAESYASLEFDGYIQALNERQAEDYE